MNPILDSKGNIVNIVSRSVRDSFENRGPSLTPPVSAGNTMLSKFAGANRGDLDKFKKLASDIQTANPSIRSPLLNQSNFYMPESDSGTGEPNRLMNQWITYYTKWHYLLGNVLSMHSELPLSRFALRGIEDKTIFQFYEDMSESMELHLRSVDILNQFFTYGEVAPHAHWSDNYNCFTDLTLLDTNYLYVKGHYLLHSEEGDDVEFYELEPDPMLQNIVKSDDYVNKMLVGYLGEEFVNAVRQNKRLLLSNFSTHMIKNKLKYSDLRGTSIVLRCLKSLLYSDKLRESQYVIADAHINPKWIWKIGQAGDLATGGYMPSEEDLAAFRDLLINANNDPMFTIITHYAVNVDAVGLNGKLLPIGQELAQIENELLCALFSNKALTTGDGPNYATASVAFRTLMSRYIPIRAKLERYYYQKIYAPVAYANKFYKRKAADLAHGVRTGNDESNQLLLPTIDWRSKSNLLDDGSIKSIISSMVSTGRLPMKVLTESLDLDYEEVRSYLYSEQATVFDSVTIEGRKKMAGMNTDETMLGQPFAPKTNQPVSLKAARGQGAQPKATKASKKDIKINTLLSIKSLTAKKDPIQTEIDKGKPEKGGNSVPVDPMVKALDIQADKKKQGTPVPDPLKSAGNRKQLTNAVVEKKFKLHAATDKGTKLVDATGGPLKNDFIKTDVDVLNPQEPDAKVN